MALSIEPLGLGPFLRVSPSLDLLQPPGFCAPSLLQPLEDLKCKQSPAHLCPCPPVDALAHRLSPDAPSDAKARPHCPSPSLSLLSSPLLGHQGPHPHFYLGLNPCLGHPDSLVDTILSPDTPSTMKIPPPGNCLGRSPTPSLWTLHPVLSILEAPCFYFCHGASHMVLSVHHHAFLEGQAPSNVRGAGEAGREPTSSLERRRKLRVVSCMINKPPFCLAPAVCSGTSSGLESAPLTSQPPHSSVEQTAAWRAELCSHPTSGAPTCLSPHPLGLTPWSKVCQQRLV